MRNKKMVEAVESSRASALQHAPAKEAEEWARFRRGVEEAVRENIGSSQARSLEWDEYEGFFCFKTSRGVRLGATGGIMEHTTRVPVDVPLMQALEEAQADVKAFDEACSKAEAYFYAERVIKEVRS